MSLFAATLALVGPSREPPCFAGTGCRPSLIEVCQREVADHGQIRASLAHIDRFAYFQMVPDR